jgi:hypothetical protein
MGRASNLLSWSALNPPASADPYWRFRASGNGHLALRALDTLFAGAFWLRISEHSNDNKIKI